VTPPAQAALLALQDLDTALDQHRHRRAALPERAELAAIDAGLVGVETRRVESAARRDVIAGRQEALERDLATTEARRGEISRRLYGGTTSATRELQAMAAEVDSLGARASGLEDQVLAVMEEREPLDSEVSEVEAEKDRLLAARAEVAGRLAAAEAAVDAEIDSVTAARAAAAARVPIDLVPVYDRLRARLGGVGAARLVGSSCSGCHLTLPAKEIDRLRREPADAVVFCDQCGRILIR
jgi:predicted  nucleic acid-binding Zn-ribbon protein